MKIDVSKSVQENILALIKDANPSLTNLTLSKITIGAVSAITADGQGRNSQVTITAIKNLGYKGSKVIKLRRIGVDQGINPLPAAVQIDPADTQAQRINKVIVALGLMASEVTVTASGGGNIGTPANEDDTSVSVVITPNANSSLYVGNPLTMQLTVADIDIDLNDAIAVADMNGFDPA